MSDLRAAYAALLLRLALGTMFIAHALLKYFVFTLPGTEQFFVSVGLPGFLAYVTFAAELVGGALLIAGFKTLGIPRVLDAGARRASPARRWRPRRRPHPSAAQPATRVTSNQLHSRHL